MESLYDERKLYCTLVIKSLILANFIKINLFIEFCRAERRKHFALRKFD